MSGGDIQGAVELVGFPLCISWGGDAKAHSMPWFVIF